MLPNTQYERDYERMVQADIYTLQQFVSHLHDAGQVHKIKTLLFANSAWMDAKYKRFKNDNLFIADLLLIISNLRDPLQPEDILFAAQLEMCRAIAMSRITSLVKEDIHIFVQLGRYREVLDIIRTSKKSEYVSEQLWILVEALGKHDALLISAELLEIFLAIEDDEERYDSLIRLAILDSEHSNTILSHALPLVPKFSQKKRFSAYLNIAEIDVNKSTKLECLEQAIILLPTLDDDPRDKLHYVGRIMDVAQSLNPAIVPDLVKYAHQIPESVASRTERIEIFHSILVNIQTYEQMYFDQGKIQTDIIETYENIDNAYEQANILWRIADSASFLSLDERIDIHEKLLSKLDKLADSNNAYDAWEHSSSTNHVQRGLITALVEAEKLEDALEKTLQIEDEWTRYNQLERIYYSLLRNSMIESIKEESSFKRLLNEMRSEDYVDVLIDSGSYEDAAALITKIISSNNQVHLLLKLAEKLHAQKLDGFANKIINDAFKVARNAPANETSHLMSRVIIEGWGILDFSKALDMLKDISDVSTREEALGNLIWRATDKSLDVIIEKVIPIIKEIEYVPRREAVTVKIAELLSTAGNYEKTMEILNETRAEEQPKILRNLNIALLDKKDPLGEQLFENRIRNTITYQFSDFDTSLNTLLGFLVGTGLYKTALDITNIDGLNEYIIHLFSLLSSKLDYSTKFGKAVIQRARNYDIKHTKKASTVWLAAAVAEKLWEANHKLADKELNKVYKFALSFMEEYDSDIDNARDYKDIAEVVGVLTKCGHLEQAMSLASYEPELGEFTGMDIRFPALYVIARTLMALDDTTGHTMLAELSEQLFDNPETLSFCAAVVYSDEDSRVFEHIMSIIHSFSDISQRITSLDNIIRLLTYFGRPEVAYNILRQEIQPSIRIEKAIKDNYLQITNIEALAKSLVSTGKEQAAKEVVVSAQEAGQSNFRSTLRQINALEKIREGNFLAAFKVLEESSPNELIMSLTIWASEFDKIKPNLTLDLLKSVTSIIGWFNKPWHEINKILSSSLTLNPI